MRRIVVACLLVVLFSPVANAVETRKRTVEVKRGQEVRLAVHSIYGKDCKGRAKAGVAILEKPKGGTVAVRNSTEKVSKGECAGKDVPGRGVFYKANANFKGKDRVVYNRNDASGKVFFKMDIVVIVN